MGRHSVWLLGKKSRTFSLWCSGNIFTMRRALPGDAGKQRDVSSKTRAVDLFRKRSDGVFNCPQVVRHIFVGVGFHYNSDK